MSKTETVRALDDIAPQRVQIQAMADLQAQLAMLTKEVDILKGFLNGWTTRASELEASCRNEMLNVAELIEPNTKVLESIQEKQIAQDSRLNTIEKLLMRIAAALPPMQEVKDERTNATKYVQPGLATSAEVSRIPSQVWEEKPPMFGKF